ncbi:unnamed protein product, partial [Adineta ricciae]
MASKTVYTTSCTIRCPSCSKSMMLKNWKDHCRQMHTMLSSMIDEKYNEMKRNVEKSRLTNATKTTTTDAITITDKPSPIPTNNLFSLKKFALTKTVDSNSQIIYSDNQANQLQSMELDIQNASINSTNPTTESSLTSSCLSPNIVDDDNFSYHELTDPCVSTPPVREILSCAQGFPDELPQDFSRVNQSNNESDSETISDDENLSENEVILTSLSMQNKEKITSARSLIEFKHIEGLKFITTQEITFVDAQLKRYPHVQWFTEDKQERVKPSRHWFTKNYPWLRAVFSGNRYGLLCIDCLEFARDETLIQRNNGAFVVRPYWKLKHKGLEGIKKHDISDLHRESRSRRMGADIVNLNGNIIGQLSCVNLENQTKKYLSALLQIFWLLVNEEIALAKFKSFIELIHKLECPAILEWFNLSNVKQRYWSHEATSEWLISISNYINHQQISSLKKTDFINLIIDETKDISVKQMICICLRYVEQDRGVIKEEIFKLEPIHDVSGEGIFRVVEEFINNLQKQVGKELIITAQTYDGAAAMRFQAQGHVRGRLSAWAIYVYCHSHLLNLSVKDSIEYSFYDSYDTIKSALVFLRDSPHRLQILINSQKVVDSSKKGQSIPKPSVTRWSYSYEIVKFACQHYSAIILTFSTISQSQTNGSSDGRRYASDLMNPVVAFQIFLLRDVLRPAMQFLRQIEKRGLCLDQFSLNVSAARESISQAMNNFDFINFRATLNSIKDFAPTFTLPSHSTRLRNMMHNDFDENELRKMGDCFINHILNSLDDRFDTAAKEIVQNLCVFSSPSSRSTEELLNNSLIQKYTSPANHKHKGVDGKTYERTDRPLLNFKSLKDDVYAFSKIVEGISTIPAILSQLAKFGSEQCPEWFRFYQILGTFAIGSNEAERTFSTLRRIKSWLRNRLSDSTIEILVKLSSLKMELTEDIINCIVQDFPPLLSKVIGNHDSTGQLNVFILLKKKVNSELLIVSREDLPPTLRNGRLTLNQKIIIRDEQRNNIEGVIVYMHIDRDSCANARKEMMDTMTKPAQKSSGNSGSSRSTTPLTSQTVVRSTPLQKFSKKPSLPRVESVRKTTVLTSTTGNKQLIESHNKLADPVEHQERAETISNEARNGSRESFRAPLLIVSAR